jgi:hypothetical protein
MRSLGNHAYHSIYVGDKNPCAEIRWPSGLYISLLHLPRPFLHTHPHLILLLDICTLANMRGIAYRGTTVHRL